MKEHPFLTSKFWFFLTLFGMIVSEEWLGRSPDCIPWECGPVALTWQPCYALAFFLYSQIYGVNGWSYLLYCVMAQPEPEMSSSGGLYCQDNRTIIIGLFLFTYPQFKKSLRVKWFRFWFWLCKRLIVFQLWAYVSSTIKLN